MDQPDLDAKAHAGALRGLERLNRWSGVLRILWPPVSRQLQKNRGRPLRLLDIASGAGDLPSMLWCKARRAGHSLDVEGWDISTHAVEYALRRARERGSEVKFTQVDALAAEPDTKFDIVVASLFLHHLSPELAIELLRRMRSWAGSLVLVNDLRRSTAGLILAHVATRVLCASSVVRTDGPRSVEGAFTCREVKELAECAGMAEASVQPRWPFRLLLSWERRQ